MASRYDVQVTVASARNLKNVNWRSGDLKPYAVLWVDPAAKCSSRVDDTGGENPIWDETLPIPLIGPIEDATLFIDVVHAGAAEGTKPLVGSARLRLRDVVDDVGIGGRSPRSLRLHRPSGRPQGEIEVKVSVRQPAYRPPEPAYAPSPYAYGVPPGCRDYPPPPPFAAPPVGYPFGAPPPPPAFGGGPYARDPYGQAAYGGGYGQTARSGKHGMGTGTGIAVGAAAGLLGGLAIAEGVEYAEDKIADEAAEKVEEDLGYGGDYGGGGDGDFF